jgi:protein SEY1
MTFEQTTSLFALAIADVLLINMWTTDIGRYGASNYGLLKVIFEVNLKLFDQKSSKKLLFVLRDFDDRGNKFESIKGILEGDLKKIWAEIYKPDKYANSTPQDFFQFEYSMLPHKNYQEESFNSKTLELKGRFEVGATDSLFLSHAEQNNVPMDGLPHFISQAWDSIRQ